MKSSLSNNYFLNEKNLVSTLSGIKIPKIVYGTAWKKEKTKDCVLKAIFCGFRAIDTACQPKHYQEHLVGEAIKEVLSEKIVSRENLFIQTKFTSLNGQDPSRIPYNPKAELKDQVRQSIEKSLQNLQLTYIDSLLMHSPMRNLKDNMDIWEVFEEYVNAGKVKHIGISNIYDFELLKVIWDYSNIKPSLIQNRFYMETKYDKDVRTFCNKNGIIYQSFWTLTANPHILQDGQTLEIANKYKKTKEQIFFKYVMSLGIVPLTGTTDETHMEQDLEVLNMPDLNSDEIKHFEKFI